MSRLFHKKYKSDYFEIGQGFRMSEYPFRKLKDLEVGDVIYVVALWGKLGDSYHRGSRATVVDLSGGMNRNVSLKYQSGFWQTDIETCHIDKIEGRFLSKLDKVLE